MFTNWFDRNIKWVFLTPALLFIALMVAYPIFYTARLSFFEWSMSAVTPSKWVGLDNYKTLLKGTDFWHALWMTSYHSSISIVLETVLGVAIAILFSRKMAGAKTMKTMMMLPMVATPVSIALVWLLIYEPSIGLINELLQRLGLETQEWLGSVSQVMPSLIIMDVWQWTPMIALITIAGIATIPSDPYESASVDGASVWQRFRHITLPLLMPTVITAVTLRMVDLLKTFDTIYATTQGGPNFASQTLNIMIFETAFSRFQFGYASALLMVFFLILIAIVLLLMGLRKRLGGIE